jgi:hypothetical protein
MDRKSSSAEPSVDLAGVKLSRYDLDLIRSNAVDHLRDYKATPAEAWVTCTLAYLIKLGHLKLKRSTDDNG